MTYLRSMTRLFNEMNQYTALWRLSGFELVSVSSSGECPEDGAPWKRLRGEAYVSLFVGGCRLIETDTREGRRASNTASYRTMEGPDSRASEEKEAKKLKESQQRKHALPL